jgi:hypothetical protein
MRNRLTLEAFHNLPRGFIMYNHASEGTPFMFMSFKNNLLKVIPAGDPYGNYIFKEYNAVVLHKRNSRIFYAPNPDDYGYFSNKGLIGNEELLNYLDPEKEELLPKLGIPIRKDPAYRNMGNRYNVIIDKDTQLYLLYEITN